MVDDYLDEREQAEQLKQWFKENWLWMVAGVGLGLGGLYGWQGWNAHLDGRSRAAGERFGEMLQAYESADRTRGDELADEIAKEYGSTPFADQAQLVVARVHVENGELEQAAATLRNVMDQSKDEELALLARLRLARVQLAQGDHAAALATLDGVVAPSVEPTIAELRGDVLLAKGDKAAALTAYQQALAATEAAGPAGLADPGLLRLKIDDVTASEPVGAAQAAP